MNKVSTESGMYGTIAEVESAPIEVPLQPWLGSEEEETDAWIGRQTRCVPPSVLEHWSIGGWSIGHQWNIRNHGLLEHWTPIGASKLWPTWEEEEGADLYWKTDEICLHLPTSRPQFVKLEMAEEENV